MSCHSELLFPAFLKRLLLHVEPSQDTARCSREVGGGGLQELFQLVVFDCERGNSACDTPVFVVLMFGVVCVLVSSYRAWVSWVCSV